MYKLISSDFDGTLVDNEESIPLSTVLTIDVLRRQNIKFAIATGRIRKSILDYNKDFHFVDYIISCNGSNVYDVKRKKDIFSAKLTKKILKEIEKKYRDQIIYFCTDQEWIKYENKKIEDKLFSEWINSNEDIRKIEIHFPDKSHAKKAMKEIEEMDLAIKHNIAHYPGQYLVELVPKSINKYTGMKELTKHLKIKEDSVVAIGDSYNDLELLKNIKHSVAVENAIDDVKKVVKHITSSNDNKGVEKIIHKLIPIDKTL